MIPQSKSKRKKQNGSRATSTASVLVINVWCIERYTKKLYDATLASAALAAGTILSRSVQLIGPINVFPWTSMVLD
ncbi:unnamed protein product [Leptosia nina]|uniref:Uncharacterized protein n=1 Tax=Leptosia nina TaxID=320188 RepID=A0AAV1J550_9NEOP